jgi:hypothetical protein
MFKPFKAFKALRTKKILPIPAFLLRKPSMMSKPHSKSSLKGG